MIEIHTNLLSKKNLLVSFRPFRYHIFPVLNIIISVMGTIVISLCNSILLLRVD